MKKLTKHEIAKIFELNEAEQQYLDTPGLSYCAIIEEREREFIDKVLKPWLAIMEKNAKNK